MGFHEGNTNPHENSVNLATFSAPSFDEGYKDPKIKTHLKKMILDLGFFACFFPPRTRTSPREHNKAWLLAETGPKIIDVDPYSVHSSFRFSLCSQVELEKMKGEEPSSSSCRNFPVSGGSATVFLVKEEIEKSTEEINWSAALSLEKSISPVANTLVRFSYSEIVTATHNFSKGKP